MIASALMLAAALQQEGPGAGAAPPVAVTASGVRLECLPDTRPGDREFATPFGVYRDPLDPVVRIADGRPVRELLRPLRDDPDSEGAWLARVVEEGLLSELAAGAAVLLEAAPGRLEAYQALEHWGRRLDPVPAALPMEKRIEWMWKRVEGSGAVRGTLIAACLATKVSRMEDARFSRVVSLSELQTALKDRRPFVRRAAARIAGAEEVFDLLAMLLEISVEDPRHAVREAAGAACAQIHPHDARQFWTLTLARGAADPRIQAAANLGRFGGPRALDPLVFVLSAHGRTRPGQYEFAGRPVQAVRSRSLTYLAGGLDGGAYDQEVLFQGSSFKVTLYAEDLTEAILAALDALAGEKTERGPEAWLQWYLEEGKPAGG